MRPAFRVRRCFSLNQHRDQSHYSSPLNSIGATFCAYNRSWSPAVPPRPVLSEPVLRKAIRGRESAWGSWWTISVRACRRKCWKRAFDPYFAPDSLVVGWKLPAVGGIVRAYSGKLMAETAVAWATRVEMWLPMPESLEDPLPPGHGSEKPTRGRANAA